MGKTPASIRDIRKEVVGYLRQQGHRNPEIAAVLQLPEGKVGMIAHELIKEDKIKPMKRGRPARSPKLSKSPRRRKIGWIDLKDERVQTLLRMVREKRTRQEIADALKVSRMFVYKAISGLEKAYGAEILISERRVWTAKEAAVELGVETPIVNKLCSDKVISASQRGKKEWLIDEDGIVQLRIHPTITGKYQCVICANSFPASGHCKVPICSPKCHSEYAKRQMKKLRTQEPTLDNTSGWVHAVLLALQSRDQSRSEELLTLSEAAERHGMQIHRITWLRQRSILTRFDHPTKRQGNRPIAACASGEVEIAARIFKEWSNE